MHSLRQIALVFSAHRRFEPCVCMIYSEKCFLGEVNRIIHLKVSIRDGYRGRMRGSREREGIRDVLEHCASWF